MVLENGDPVPVLLLANKVWGLKARVCFPFQNRVQWNDSPMEGGIKERNEDLGWQWSGFDVIEN